MSNRSTALLAAAILTAAGLAGSALAQGAMERLDETERALASKVDAAARAMASELSRLTPWPAPPGLTPRFSGARTR